MKDYAVLLSGVTGVRKPSAFTLLELLIVIVIMGIMAAIVIPKAMETDKDAVIAGASRVSQALEYAQSEAMTRKTPVTVQFYPGSESFTISDASGILTDPLTHQPCNVNLPSAVGAENLNLISANFGGTSSSITFQSNGEPVQGGSTQIITSDSKVIIQCGTHAMTVSVSPVIGKVTVTGN